MNVVLAAKRRHKTVSRISNWLDCQTIFYISATWDADALSWSWIEWNLLTNRVSRPARCKIIQTTIILLKISPSVCSNAFIFSHVFHVFDYFLSIRPNSRYKLIFFSDWERLKARNSIIAYFSLYHSYVLLWNKTLIYLVCPVPMSFVIVLSFSTS